MTVVRVVTNVLAPPGTVEAGIVLPGTVWPLIVLSGIVDPGIVDPGPVLVIVETMKLVTGLLPVMLPLSPLGPLGPVDSGAFEEGDSGPLITVVRVVINVLVCPGTVDAGIVLPGTVLPLIVLSGIVDPGIVDPGSVESNVVVIVLVIGLLPRELPGPSDPDPLG